MCEIWRKKQTGFTLVELIAVITLLGVLSVVLFSRIGNINSSRVLASRDDVIAAFFFAQQLAMSRSNIQLTVSSGSINVTENGTSIKLDSNSYPLTMPSGISLSATPASFTYDKLGRTSAGVIQVRTNDSSYSINVNVEITGYAH